MDMDVLLHELQEFLEIDSAIAVFVEVPDHHGQLFLGWVLPQRSHNCMQILILIQEYPGGHCSLPVLVKKSECFLELTCFTLAQVVIHLDIFAKITLHNSKSSTHADTN